MGEHHGDVSHRAQCQGGFYCRSGRAKGKQRFFIVTNRFNDAELILCKRCLRHALAGGYNGRSSETIGTVRELEFLRRTGRLV